MPDFDAITVALAARFAAAQVTPPTGYDNVKLSTGDLPGQMTPLPTVLVFPEAGRFDYTGGKRDSHHTYTVRFYYNQTGDLERDMVALRKWAAVLVNQLSASLSLGLGSLVTWAHITTWAIAILPYAGQEYTGIELTVEINVNEPWSPGG